MKDNLKNKANELADKKCATEKTKDYVKDKVSSVKLKTDYIYSQLFFIYT